MKCKICESKNIKVIYNAQIRDGGLGHYTSCNVPIYQCQNCDVIWHENVLKDTKEYYETTEYRDSLEGNSEEQQFYKLHDGESLAKFEYTGTDIFRDKIVADIGCGCGAFLDFIRGVSEKVIAVEPSETYRKIMKNKGFYTYPYMDDALKEFKNKVDVVVSFDVVEHVENPQQFLKEVFELLSESGQAVIGTPTDAPIMRELLGEIYEKKILFSTQHLWIFGEKNLKILAESTGFSNVELKYFQRYGIENLLGWIRDKEPKSKISSIVSSKTMDSVWKAQCSENGISDYVVLYLKK